MAKAMSQAKKFNETGKKCKPPLRVGSRVPKVGALGEDPWRSSKTPGPLITRVSGIIECLFKIRGSLRTA
jgi:hypothetical protein